MGRPSSHDGSHNDQQGLYLPFFRFICGNGLHLCLPFSSNSLGLCVPSCSNTSSSHLASRSSVSTSHLALPCTRGTSASDLAVMAFSALLAGSTLAVSSARADAAPTTGSAPPHSCALMLKGSGSFASAFSARAAGPRGSCITAVLPGADNAPPDSCRTLLCGPGCFRVSG